MPARWTQTRPLARVGVGAVAAGVLLTGAAVATTPIARGHGTPEHRAPAPTTAPAWAQAHGPAAAHDRPAIDSARRQGSLDDHGAVVRPVTPDVLVEAGHTVSAATLRAVRRLPQVTDVVAVAAGTVRVQGHPAHVYAVDPAAFRPFTPRATAGSDPLWQAVGRGELAASFDMAHELALPLGDPVVVSAGRSVVPIRVGAFASTALPGVDAVVGADRAVALHLAPRSALVIAAPKADPIALRSALHRLLGRHAEVDLLHRVIRLRDPGQIVPSGTIATVLAAAESRVGMPYVWGATGPDAFDCSGLVGWAWARAGVRLPRTAAEQWYAGPHVPYADARPGDLLFWAYDPTAPGFIDHVALYLGHGMMVVAPHTGETVQVRAVPLAHFAGVVRVDPGAAGS